MFKIFMFVKFWQSYNDVIVWSTLLLKFQFPQLCDIITRKILLAGWILLFRHTESADKHSSGIFCNLFARSR
ncbi:hypothetical protein DYD21_00635 [Rhodohalobacter sp. SW132]|nr:hypothetical protein DYD21_00635 [Rhodohalobacter sp. SW132]